MYQRKLIQAICKSEDLMMRNMIKGFVDSEIMPIRQKIDDDKDHVLVKLARQGLVNR